MNIFKCNDDRNSYTYSITKIPLCIVLIILLISRNDFIHVDNYVLNIIIGIFCVAAVLASALCIYISVAEIMLIHEKREKVKTDLNHALKYSKEFSIEEILSLLVTNDIIEIWIVSNDQIIEIGSSSDCREGSAQFFDKRYYVNEKEFTKIDYLRTEILPYFVDEKVKVISIDGISPK